MNAAGQLNPSTSACAATATTDIVTSTSASASSRSARLSAFSSRGEEYQPALSSSGGTNTSRTTCGSMSTSLEARARRPARARRARARSGTGCRRGRPPARAGRRRTAARREARGRPRERGSLGSRALLSPPVDSEDHVAGPYDAPLELVMYGDFQCPYCSAAQSIVRRVRDRLDGRLRFVFRHLPLTEVHPDAERAAEAAEAAAAQGSFWEMHDALYANGGRLGGCRPGGGRRPDRARRRALSRRPRIGRVRGPRGPRRRRGARQRRHARRPRSSSTASTTPRPSTPGRWSRHSRRSSNRPTNLASLCTALSRRSPLALPCS